MPRRRKPAPIDKAMEAAEFARTESGVAARRAESDATRVVTDHPSQPTAANTDRNDRDPVRTHGPARPVTALHGVSHLRAVVNLREADLERLCEDAACELERLRVGNRKRFIWD
ncbi:MAG: hypothetical protein Q7R41_18745 [Phycisphaerales bacterium]|nr:hypothetical protein [Phycisphaerales bacterium]